MLLQMVFVHEKGSLNFFFAELFGTTIKKNYIYIKEAPSLPFGRYFSGRLSWLLPKIKPKSSCILSFAQRSLFLTARGREGRKTWLRYAFSAARN